SARAMGAPKKTIRICEVGTHIDGPAERIDGIGITPLGHSGEAMRKISPGFLGIARDRAIGPFSDFRKGLPPTAGDERFPPKVADKTRPRRYGPRVPGRRGNHSRGARHNGEDYLHRSS